MAISDKLEYLMETKEQIKNAIIDKGQEIEENMSFRDYAQKIENIEIKKFFSLEELNNYQGKENEYALLYEKNTSSYITGIVKTDNVKGIHKAQIDVYQNGEIIKTIQSNDDGFFKIYLESGTYDVIVTKQNYTSYIIKNIVINGLKEFKLGELKIYAGDIYNDGKINLMDQTGWSGKETDLNEDGDIDYLDYVLLLTNYNKCDIEIEYTEKSFLLDTCTFKGIYQYMNSWTELNVKDTAKIFNSINEMENSTQNKENSICIVYRNIKEVTNDDTATSLFNGMYIYKNGKWNILPTQLSTNDTQVLEGDFYGSNGLQKGSYLEGKISEDFNDVYSLAYAYSSYQYDSLDPIILSDDNLTDLCPWDTIYTIPCKRDGTPLYDTSQLTDMSYFFQGFRQLISIPKINTINATNMKYMFDNCINLRNVAELDSSNVINMQYMFKGCIKLEDVPEMNTMNVTQATSMFEGCKSLKNVPIFNFSNLKNSTRVLGLSSAFKDCPSLTDESLNNILETCISINNASESNKTLRKIRFNRSTSK